MEARRAAEPRLSWICPTMSMWREEGNWGTIARGQRNSVDLADGCKCTREARPSYQTAALTTESSWCRPHDDDRSSMAEVRAAACGTTSNSGTGGQLHHSSDPSPMHDPAVAVLVRVEG